MKTRKQPPIQSITRAISILRCFSDNKELGLTEISKLVGLHKSTTAGIINTLKDEAFLVQNQENGKLSLGIELFCLAVNAKQGIGELSMPFLDNLLHETGETVNLAIRDGVNVVYVEKKESPHSMRICTSVGQRLPLYCTAIGKSLLAFLDDSERESIMNELVFTKYTDNTITNIDMLLAVLETIHTSGVAYDFEELENGLICVAAPVFNKHHQPIAAVSVSGPSVRMDESIRNRIAKLLIRESQALSTRLIASSAI
jgi:DNA-binding IclR family transcriptional regulator